jgi:hypothetical protein
MPKESCKEWHVFVNKKGWISIIYKAVIRKTITIRINHNRVVHPSYDQSDFPTSVELHLARADVGADGRRVVVLEVVQGQTASSAHLVGDSLASRARCGHNVVRIARSNVGDGHQGRTSALVAP